MEIREQVGAENFFLFGLSTGEVFTLKSHGYNPRDYYEGNPVLKRVIDQIASGLLFGWRYRLVPPLVDSLLRPR